MLRRSTLALTLAAMLAPAVAWAQPDLVDPEEEQREQALDIAGQAFDEQQRGNFGEASRLYRQAYCLDPDSQTVFNLGTVARSLGEPQQAAELFTLYLVLDPNGTLSADAKAILSRLGIKGPITAASIACPRRPPPEPGDDPAPTPTEPRTPPPPAEQPADTAAGPRGSGGGALRWIGLATTVVGVGAAGVGVYFGVEAQRHSDAISNNSGAWTAELLARQQLGEDAERNQIILLSAGAAVTLAGVIMMVAGWPSDGDASERGRVALRPLLAPGATGLALTGGF